MESLSLMEKIFIWAIPVIFAITVHEVAHGWMANKLGDKTALMLGRITLNPIKHIDLFGTIIVPIILLTASNFVFGWAKPVPVNYQNLRNPRKDSAVVAAVGPLSNLIMAFMWAVVFKLGIVLTQNKVPYAYIIAFMGQAGILVNIVLAVLNLLPIPPLDGSHVVASFLPNRLANRYMSIGFLGFLIIVFLLYFGILGRILAPPVNYFIQFIRFVFQI